jgi:hypothetical protein
MQPTPVRHRASLVIVARYSIQDVCFDNILLSADLFYRETSQTHFAMPAWTHLIRFIAVEDSRIHLGQLVDTSRDIGLDSVNGTKIEAYLINGSIFDGEVTQQILTVKQILSPVSMEDCNYIRCLGLNYMDHAKVTPGQH